MSEIAQRTPVQDVVEHVRDDEFRLEVRQALPDTVSVDKFERITITALMENPDLAKLDRGSLFRAIVKCAAAGLLPDGKQAAIVPYKGKAQFLPMVDGVRLIAAEYGWTITSHVVTQNDFFEHMEEPPSITHRPVRPGEDRGAFVAVYAVARHRDGRRIQRVLYAAEVAKRQKVAQTQAVWNGWTEQMWEKTAVHDIAGELPLDPKDRERIVGVLRAAELDPSESARALYGAPVARELEASSVGTPALDPPAGAASGADEGDTSLGGSEPSSAPAAAQAPLDAPDDEARMLADEAARYTPPSGKYGSDPSAQGWIEALTLQQILEAGEDGERYLGMLVRRLTTPPEYVAAVDAFARVYLPEVWAEAQALKQPEAAA